MAAFWRVGRGVLIAYNCPRENLSFLEFIRIPDFRWVNKYGSSAHNLHVAVGVLYQSTKFLVFVRPDKVKKTRDVHNYLQAEFHNDEDSTCHVRRVL